MKLKPIIWGIQFIMIFTFLIFSFFPLIYNILNRFPSNFGMIVIISFPFGLTIYGIITLKSKLREFSTVFFSIGIIFSFSDSFILSFGVVISWVFYETWMIAWTYNQLDMEYLPYSSNSPERLKLNRSFQSRIISISLLAWIALSLSWGLLFIAQNFFIQLGTFGTLGISISIAMVLILYLIPKYTEVPPNQSLMQD